MLAQYSSNNVGKNNMGAIFKYKYRCNIFAPYIGAIYLKSVHIGRDLPNIGAILQNVDRSWPS